MKWAVALLVCVGCRAEVAPAADLGSDFATQTVDFSADDGLDFGPADLFCSGVAPEVCGNGCDDDKNGYTDGDDPACTPQLLGTGRPSSQLLYRLLLQPMAHTLLLDSNVVPPSSFAVADRSLAPGVAFLVSESMTTGLIRRLQLTSDGAKGMYSDFTPGYATRDVCVFNGELIVVQRAPASVLHRFNADGKTENGMVSLPLYTDLSVIATSCAGGDGRLVVAVHDLTVANSEFLVFDASGWAPIYRRAIPPPLAALGLDRCLDLAWTPSGFYGLFAPIGAAEPFTDAPQIYPFALDGAVGPPIDAGVLHGLGTFLP